jgi:N,N-dimethylformamidase
MTSSKRIVSYCDPLSVRPGGEVRFMVSSLDDEPFDAQLVQVICGDIAPGGHGFQETLIESGLNGHYPGRRQETIVGSYGIIPPNPILAGLESLRLEVCVFPTAVEGTRTLISSHGTTGGFAIDLVDGTPCVTIGGQQSGTAELRSDRPITQRRWTRITASYDAAQGVLRLSADPLVSAPGDLATAHAWSGERTASASVASNGPLLIAARQHGGTRDQHFDGRLDACRLGTTPDGEPEVRWDFARDIGTERITDAGSHGLHGTTKQLPNRAVPGVLWDGTVHHWQTDQSHYGAIHFHSDDLADAEWETSCNFEVPATLPSGAYALRSSVGTSSDYAVFFVQPARDAQPAPVAWLASTITYRAYANARIGLSPDLIFGNWSPAEIVNDAFVAEHPEVGLGTYETHADGHGVSTSSHLRPVMNLKPGGGLWSFNADTNVIAWLHQARPNDDLDAHGPHASEPIAHDVITDDALHEEGDALVSRYRVIVTGTHPEYWTTPMLDALERWLANGGRLMVMGANGFYWRTGVHPTAGGAIEVRRAEDGARAWIAEPGESYMETTGELGGLWRRLGRAPNRVSGAGFAAQGFSVSGHYRRSTAWNDPRVAFAVEGLSDSVIFGDHGTVGGGAAGQEIDRFDESLGSPSHSVVLASSEGHPPDMLQTKEEFFATGIPIPGTAARADVVFFETPKGGAVFNTGSIAWAGSLATNGYDNDVAKLTTNVLRRFVDETPFAVPDNVTSPLGVPAAPEPQPLIESGAEGVNL